MTARNDTGQAVAELALLLPLLLLIMAGCLDIGRAFPVWLTLANATREGARYGSIYLGKDRDDIRQEAQLDIEAARLDLARAQVDVDWPEGRSVGHPIVVTARYDLPMITGYLVGAQPLRIRASTSMVIIGGGN